MSNPTTLAILSPYDNAAGWLSPDSESVTVIAPPSLNGLNMPTGRYVSRFSTSRIVEADSDDEALQQLEQSTEDSFALDFTMLLFDSEVSSETRSLIATELNEIFTCEDREKYVLDILLAAPLDSTIDIDATIRLAAGHGKIPSFVKRLADCQTRVRKIRSIWMGMREDQMVKQSGHDHLTGVLISAGVFRRLAEEASTQAELDSLRSQLLFDAALTSRCDARILTSFLSQIRSNLPAGSIRRSSLLGNAAKREMDLERETSDSVSRKADVGTGADAKREWAEHTVEQIARLFSQGEDVKARRFLAQLVEDQTRDTLNHSYVVKSLCNLAQKCTTAGRREISLDCLKDALHYTDGIDSVLYLQIGNELREIKQFDESLDCYLKAEQLDDGSRAEGIRNEIIRVSVAKGQYEIALQQYQSIVGLDTQPQALTALATLHRKMGQLHESRERYWQVSAAFDGYSHIADAGLAEVAKQSGHLHHAIRGYNELFQKYAELEDRPRKIYEMSRSHLFRLTGQFEKAQSKLEELLATYHHDCDIHLQLAKVFSLKGDSVRAKKHFDQSHGPILSVVASELYDLAMGLNSVRDDRRTISETLLYEPSNYMPEDQGLASCRFALQALKADEPNIACDALHNIAFVDRLHSDFGSVLWFHATKRMNLTFDYRSSVTLCRIAKRGYPELRKSIRAIAGADFDAAFSLEDRMCLFVA